VVVGRFYVYKNKLTANRTRQKERQRPRLMDTQIGASKAHGLEQKHLAQGEGNCVRAQKLRDIALLSHLEGEVFCAEFSE
jgi:hypothetical protein